MAAADLVAEQGAGQAADDGAAVVATADGARLGDPIAPALLARNTDVLVLAARRRGRGRCRCRCGPARRRRRRRWRGGRRGPSGSWKAPSVGMGASCGRVDEPKLNGLAKCAEWMGLAREALRFMATLPAHDHLAPSANGAESPQTPWVCLAPICQGILPRRLRLAHRGVRHTSYTPLACEPGPAGWAACSRRPGLLPCPCSPGCFKRFGRGLTNQKSFPLHLQ